MCKISLAFDDNNKYCVTIIGVVNSIYVLVFLSRASLTDPGFIPRNNLTISTDSDAMIRSDGSKFWDTCWYRYQHVANIVSIVIHVERNYGFFTTNTIYQYKSKYEFYDYNNSAWCMINDKISRHKRRCVIYDVCQSVVIVFVDLH